MGLVVDACVWEAIPGLVASDVARRSPGQTRALRIVRVNTRGHSSVRVRDFFGPPSLESPRAAGVARIRPQRPMEAACPGSPARTLCWRRLMAKSETQRQRLALLPATSRR